MYGRWTLRERRNTVWPKISASVLPAVLKVGHHGSRGSSGSAFLARVSPELAILSAPCVASRGLPSRQAIERILLSGAKLWWTGRDGAVIVALRRDGSLGVETRGRARDCAPR